MSSTLKLISDKKTHLKEKKNKNKNAQNKNAQSKTLKKDKLEIKKLLGGADKNNNLNNLNNSEMSNQNQEYTEELEENEKGLKVSEAKKDNLQPVGTFNNPDKSKKITTLEKEQIKGRSGLSLTYPPIINTSKEDALAFKMKNKREPGFTDYWGKIDDKLEPKFIVDNFYPKYLSFNLLHVEKAKNNENNQSETENNQSETENNQSETENNEKNEPK
jgi:hypothetical protein